MADTEKPDLTALVVQLLSAYVSNNTVPSSEISELIRSTRAALSEEPQPATPPTPEFVPAVSVRKSLSSPEHIISLINGKPYKSLKRHLSSHGLTPDDYRDRYGLPKSYPMVAPGYSQQRREVAERLGLGKRLAEHRQKSRETAQTIEEAAPAPEVQPAQSPAAPRARKGARKTASSSPKKAPGRSKKAKAEDSATAVVVPAEVVEIKPKLRRKPASKPVRTVPDIEVAPAAVAPLKPAPRRKRVAKSGEDAKAVKSLG